MTELEYNDFLKSETDLEREANLLMLEHHGVKGMKWGDKNGPPYPLSEAKKKDNRERAKKQREQKEGFFAKQKKKKAEKLKVAAAKRKKEEAAAKKKAEEDAKKKAAENEKIREKLLTSTDAKFIDKHKNLLTYQELNDRVNRINLEKRMSELAAGPKQKSALKVGEEYLNSLGNMAASIGKMSEAMTKSYNAYNVINKSMQANAEAERKKQEREAEAKKKRKKR